MPIPYTRGENHGSYVWDPPIKDLPRDLDKLQPRQFTVDRTATRRKLDLAAEVFDGLLQPRLRSNPWWSLGLTWDAILLVGLEGFMLAMYDQPEAVHRLMAFLRDDRMRLLDWLEREGLVVPTNGSNYVGSGGVGFTTELPDESANRPLTCADIWGFAESQETVGVSPEMFAEFILPYQLPLLSRFGLNCYGCCEPVHSRIDHLIKIPRLRRISVSPWCDQQAIADRLGNRCIFSRKPNPAPVCVDFDEDVIRKDLRTTLGIAGKLPLEIIMKDTHTVQNDPTRLSRWVSIALEEVNRYVGG